MQISNMTGLSSKPIMQIYIDH